jgi:hypothetical protein
VSDLDWTQKMVWAELVTAAAHASDIPTYRGELGSTNTAHAPDLVRLLKVQRWLSIIPASERDVLWARATRQRWKQICWRYGISRPTAHRRLQRGLNAILDHLRQGHNT